MLSFWKNLDIKTRVTLATLGLILFCVWFRELTPKNGGLGSDGALYSMITTQFSLDLLTTLDDYAIRRILPPAIVHGAMQLFGIPFTNANLIWGFTWANAALATLAMNLWCRSAEILNVRERGQWLGFILLVCSYSTLKWILYYPILGDYFALALGSATLLTYLRGSTVGVLALTVAGSVTWPSMIYMTIPLVAFPYRPRSEDQPAPLHLNRVVAAIGAVATFAGARYAIEKGFHFSVEPLLAALHLSMTIQALYIAAAFWFLLDSRGVWEDLHPRRWITRWEPWAAIALPIVLTLISREVAGRPSWIGEGFYAATIFYAGTVQPGVFALAHVLFFGPLLLLVPLEWRRISASIRREGTGLTLIFVLAAIVTLDSESRHHVLVLPFIALFLVKVIDDLEWTPGRVWSVAAISLLFSKVWMTMNVDQNFAFVGDTGYEFYYEANLGPWMQHGMYFAQLIVAGFTFALLCHWFGGAQRPSTRKNTG